MNSVLHPCGTDALRIAPEPESGEAPAGSSPLFKFVAGPEYWAARAALKARGFHLFGDFK